MPSHRLLSLQTNVVFLCLFFGWVFFEDTTFATPLSRASMTQLFDLSHRFMQLTTGSLLVVIWNVFFIHPVIATILIYADNIYKHLVKLSSMAQDGAKCAGKHASWAFRVGTLRPGLIGIGSSPLGTRTVWPECIRSYHHILQKHRTGWRWLKYTKYTWLVCFGSGLRRISSDSRACG